MIVGMGDVTTGPQPQDTYASGMTKDQYIAQLENWIANTPTSGGSPFQFIQDNSTAVIIGLGLLVLLLVMSGKRR